ncbi:MAG: signal peptidase I [Anaerolinea sp.]|nr:signal peptidase I [Anaerolinea sp.]
MDSDYGALGAGIGIVGWLLYMAVIVFYIFCMWKIYVKAGKPGWAAIVPIYNILVQLEIVGRPWWYLLLLLVPVVNIVIGIMILFDLAKVFGKGTGFGFGLLFLSFIFIPILAFGDAQYQAPVVAAQ